VNTFRRPFLLSFRFWDAAVCHDALPSRSICKILTYPRSCIFAAYYAEIAGLNYNIQNTASGFQVFLSGYNHKLATLGEKILEKIVSFEVKEERFTVIKVSVAAHVRRGLGNILDERLFVIGL
jgi:hypothetical protein